MNNMNTTETYIRLPCYLVAAPSISSSALWRREARARGQKEAGRKAEENLTSKIKVNQSAIFPFCTPSNP
jgi:hypothetical protein